MHTQFTMHVPRSPQLDELVERLTSRLQKRLWVVRPDLVRLHGRMVHNTGREGTVCTLDLHLPTAQLYAEAAAASAQAALTAAGEELFTQLDKSLKKLREHRRHAPRAGEVFAATPAPAANGHADLGRELPRLREFIARRLREFAATGDSAPALDEREVLDEVVVEALSAPEAGDGPPDSDRHLRLLAERVLRRMLRGGNGHGEAEASLDSFAGDSLAAEPLDAGGDSFDAADDEAAPLASLIAANQATPEQIAATAELVEQVAAAARGLAAEQRHDVLLWLLEGFTVRDLAALSRRPRRQVAASLAAARRQLVAAPDFPEALRRQLR